MDDAQAARRGRWIWRVLREAGVAFRSLGEVLICLSPEALEARHPARSTTVPAQGAPLTAGEQKAWDRIVRGLTRPRHDPGNGRG